jgi:excinuclease UvrABC nuclease subunit
MPYKDRQTQLDYLKRWKKENKESFKTYIDDYISEYDKKWPPCVYGIYHTDGRCLYIGESKKPRRRKSNHFSILKSVNQSDSIVQKKLHEGIVKKENLIFKILEAPLLTEDERLKKEKEWIRSEKPLWNVK